MGETILFPDDQHRLLKLGEKALAKDDFQQALQYFQDCYQVAPEYTVQKRILFCLEKLGAYRQGLTMAQDHQEAYDRDPEGVDQLLRLYLLDQQYLTARSYLVALEKVQPLVAVDFSQWRHQLEHLETSQLFYDPDLATIKREVLRKLDEQGLPVAAPAWENFTNGLTFNCFVSLCSDLLPKINNPFLRPRLVEELLKLGYQETILIKNLEGVLVEVSLAEEVLPADSPVLAEMLSYLEEVHGQEDPVMAAAVASEVRAHFAMTFPFSPQVENPEAWSESYWLEYQVAMGQADMAALLPFNAIQAYKQRLREKMQGLY